MQPVLTIEVDKLLAVKIYLNYFNSAWLVQNKQQPALNRAFALLHWNLKSVGTYKIWSRFWDTVQYGVINLKLFRKKKKYYTAELFAKLLLIKKILWIKYSRYSR
jgi:hypothetical protein